MNLQKCAPIAAALWLCASAASANVITLSDYSLDDTDPTSLDATLHFSVLGDLLTLTVTNQTTGVDGYHINRVYFNAGDGVTGLNLDDAPQRWDLRNNTNAGDFGVFDFALWGGSGHHRGNLAPGESMTFLFTISGTGLLADFLTSTSTSGHIAAAQFVAGPRNDRGTGAVAGPTAVPAPGALALLCIAAGLTVRTDRRRRR